MMQPSQFVSALKTLSFEHTFNPYVDRCAVHDKIDAPQKRAGLLKAMLDAAMRIELDAIWIGRDLGYRGGRRTGLALTDDIHSSWHAERWQLAYERPTKGRPVAERTAAVIWSVLQEIDAPIFLWNVFPLHPHEPDDPFTNRAHNARERAAGEDILASLVMLLSPKRIVAIGNDAAKTAIRVAHDQCIVQVRHPSYGGQNEFLDQIRSTYRCRSQSLF
jgi:uracil-DNA glycosylase